AKRIRRTAGGGAVAASAALSSADLFAGIRAYSSPDAGVECHAGRSLAHERTCGGDDALRGGRAGGRFLCDWGRARARQSTIMGSAVLASPSSGLSPDGASDAPGSWLGLVLSATGNLRTRMDQHRPGAVAGSPAAGQFSFHH